MRCCLSCLGGCTTGTIAPLVCMVLLQAKTLSNWSISGLPCRLAYTDVIKYFDDFFLCGHCLGRRGSSADAGSGAAGGSGGKKASHVGVIIASVLFALMLLACLGAQPISFALQQRLCWGGWVCLHDA